ncbi:cell wall-binding repeat-containing protein [Alkalihalobacillus sp. BA299]|uniref:cell wall-binding repeat-containing protein n=1 Tax=Alkalihalobacillus sp. BA299 TaxID=2815938 RepID=UPI001ADB7E69|nr:cell wall-binding repeat-containing protein [Alkalihalobacillus sp. BA299]
MERIVKTKLIEQEFGYQLVVYLSPETTEFSLEFLSKLKEEKNDLLDDVKFIIKQKYQNVKITSISVVVGTGLFMTLPVERTEVMAADFTMSYLYFGTTTQQVQFVDRTKGTVQVVSPSYFNLNNDGTLKLPQPFPEQFVKEMKQRGVKVVPFLSNHWNRDQGRAALQNRELLVSQIVDTINYYDLDGINVDIEGLNEDDKEAFTDLVKMLRAQLPEDKEVSVAVAANPNAWSIGWHGMYDYKALAEHSDYLMVMAYDESYQGSPQGAGPVASLPWVERSIIEVLKHAPPEKVVLGLPFFGRYWVEGEPLNEGGKGITKSQVEHLIQAFNGKVSYDTQAQSPRAEVTIPSPYQLGSRTLSPGNYTIWYENATSLQEKVKLVHKYNLKGTGSWALGQENPEIWNEYESWIKPFVARKQISELHGANRYATSAVISNYAWENANTVVIGRGDVAVDALTSSVLAKKHNAPLLLVTPSKIPAEIKAELTRLNPKEIIIVGGETAVSTQVEQELEKMGYIITRISGANRYDTAVQIAESTVEGNEIFLATGDSNSPDALSIAPYAAKKQIPILFTEQKSLPSTLKKFIIDYNISKVTIIGGETAISDSVILELENLGISHIERVAGSDRYATSVEIVNKYKEDFILEEVFFASGNSFIDALPGSSVAAAKSAPVLLTSGNQVPPSIKSWMELNDESTKHLYFLGGQQVIQSEVRRILSK